MIRFGCPNCKMVLQAADNQPGVLVSCPKCKTQMKVPAPIPAPPSPVPSVPQPPALHAATIPPASRKNKPSIPQPSVTPVGDSGSPPLPQGPGPASPWWKRALREGREIGVVTWGQTVRLVNYGQGLWRKRSLDRAALDAQQTLGVRMYEAGAGDPQLRAQIAAVDEQIRQADARKEATTALQAEREKLLLQLACPGVAQPGPIPGMETEQVRAKEYQAALQHHSTAMQSARAALSPRDGTARRRMLIGFGAVGGVGLLAFCLLCGGLGTIFGVRGKQGNGPDNSNAQGGSLGRGTPGSVAKTSVNDVLTDDMQIEELVKKMGPPFWVWKHPHAPAKVQKYGWKLADGRYDLVDVYNGRISTYQNLNEVQFTNIRRSTEN